MKVLVFGASGMLGSAVVRVLGRDTRFEVAGTVRTSDLDLRDHEARIKVVPGVDVLNTDDLAAAISAIRPEAIINCVGVVKQKSEANDPLVAVPINTILPHRLARLGQLVGARLVHVSTDCVFSGSRGLYQESDTPDATDLYGRSKLLGEVVDAPNAVTIRTSIIGPELHTRHGLLEWFLSQKDRIYGYSGAIFSGLPTVILAEIIRDLVLPNVEFRGLYHVSADPINKFDLLRLFSQIYQKDIQIVPREDPRVDRSLDSARFRQLTGYEPGQWSEMVRRMREFG
jgi:dTDP-4-dehydrorhamnose reductase